MAMEARKNPSIILSSVTFDWYAQPPAKPFNSSNTKKRNFPVPPGGPAQNKTFLWEPAAVLRANDGPGTPVLAINNTRINFVLARTVPDDDPIAYVEFIADIGTNFYPEYGSFLTMHVCPENEHKGPLDSDWVFPRLGFPDAYFCANQQHRFAQTKNFNPDYFNLIANVRLTFFPCIWHKCGT